MVKVYEHPHLKRSAFAEFGTHLDLSTHALHNLLADVQTKTCSVAVHIVAVFGLAEQLKQVAHVLRLHADAGVRDLDIKLVLFEVPE